VNENIVTTGGKLSLRFGAWFARLGLRLAIVLKHAIKAKKTDVMTLKTKQHPKRRT
jgi:hypothetical protein